MLSVCMLVWLFVCVDSLWSCGYTYELVCVHVLVFVCVCLCALSDVCCLVRCGVVWSGVVWSGLVRCLCGVVWCGVVWRSTVAAAHALWVFRIRPQPISCETTVAFSPDSWLEIRAEHKSLATCICAQMRSNSAPRLAMHSLTQHSSHPTINQNETLGWEIEIPKNKWASCGVGLEATCSKVTQLLVCHASYGALSHLRSCVGMCFDA